MLSATPLAELSLALCARAGSVSAGQLQERAEGLADYWKYQKVKINRGNKLNADLGVQFPPRRLASFITINSLIIPSPPFTAADQEEALGRERRCLLHPGRRRPGHHEVEAPAPQHVPGGGLRLAPHGSARCKCYVPRQCLPDEAPPGEGCWTLLVSVEIPGLLLSSAGASSRAHSQKPRGCSASGLGGGGGLAPFDVTLVTL